MAQFNEEEEMELRQIFNDLDVDNSGHLNVKELRVMAQKFGQNPTKEELSTAVKNLDFNENGVFDFEDMKVVVAAIIIKRIEDRRRELERAMATLLRKQGLQEDEQITKDLFYHFQLEQGEDPLSMEEVDEIFEDLGTYTSSKEELAALLCS